jgi:two-component system, chemotaxis family, protein-glutamate methylesterase/glutaminase
MMARALVVVGTSLGGLDALSTLLAGLPASFPLPIVVVQHRGREPDDGLARLLQGRCALEVGEATDKEVLASGHVYIAPAEYHVLVERGSLALSTEGAVNCSRPSIDVLFESAAATYGRSAVGVILTGASHDGARGAAEIKHRGGYIIVQDPMSSECRIMPDGAIAAAPVDLVVPLREIAAALVEVCVPTSA